MAANKDIKRDVMRRMYLMYFVILLFGSAILFRVINIQFIHGEYWREKEKELTMKYFNIDAARGNIFSSDGSLLATSVPIFELRMDVVSDPVTDKIFYQQVDSLAYCLSKTFPTRSKTEWKNALKKARKKRDRYFLIAGKVNYATLKEVRTFPIFRMGRYKGGLLVEQHSRRELPYKNLAQRTIGYDRKNNKPLGIEGAYDEYLTGISGKRLMQKIAGGVWKPINRNNEIEPKDGRDVISTIDIGIQDVAHHALQKQLIAQNAGHGCAVLMEVKTGAIKAMVNLSRIDTGTYAESYNYAIGEATEPGSTFKLASLMAAIEDGYTDLNEIVDTEGGRKAYAAGYIMKDSHEGGYGKISLKQVFEKSSNVGTSKIIMKYYAKQPQKYIDRLYAFGIHKPLQLKLPGEGKPYIKDTHDKLWSALSLPLMSIGYEEKLTPLQVLNLYNTVANNGKMMRPYFVEEVQENGKTVKKFGPEVINPSICSQRTIDMAREMLEGVVLEGTATNLRNTPYQIAAKTGTAQIAKGREGYGDIKSYQASLCGYFPAKEPLYSIIVVVNAPSNSVFYGNDVAGPVFREIADKVYSMSTEIHKPLQQDTSSTIVRVPFVKSGKYDDIKILSKKLSFGYFGNVSPDADFVRTNTTQTAIRVSPVSGSEMLVPDVIGMGLKDALSLLENKNLRVKVNGRGTIKKQSVPAGQRVPIGQVITIELS